jgi:NADPH:quinone reductase
VKAAYVEQMGWPNTVKVGDVPRPQPRAGQVLLRTAAAGVGPWDVAMISGAFGQLPLPLIPGLEVAGVVETSGEGADLRPGDEVYGSLGFTPGGFAEYTLADADRLAVKPSRASFEEMVALTVAGGTAYEGLADRLSLRPGETVLITAASGGVGTAAIQIAAALEARVIGVASGRNHHYIRELGASATFDYNDAGWEGALLEALPGGVDALFDASGGETRDAALRAVRDGGRAVFIVGAPDTIDRRIRGEFFGAEVDRRRLEAVNELIEAGGLRAELDAVFPLDRAADALEHVAAGHTRGKVVLTLR